jgi:hypothetical protein
MQYELCEDLVLEVTAADENTRVEVRFLETDHDGSINYQSDVALLTIPHLKALGNALVAYARAVRANYDFDAAEDDE